MFCYLMVKPSLNREGFLVWTKSVKKNILPKVWKYGLKYITLE